MIARITSSHLLATLAASLFGIVAAATTEAAPLTAPSKPLVTVNTPSELVTNVYYRRWGYRHYPRYYGRPFFPRYYGRPYYYGAYYYRPYRYHRLRYYRPYRRWHYYDTYYYGPRYGYYGPRYGYYRSGFYGPRYGGVRLSVPFVDLYIR